MNKITILDIAREAGVSKAAVSYVLNDKKGVGDETRKKIEEVIEKHGYRPNSLSKNLARGRNYSIHAVIRREAAPACKAFYFSVIAQMVEQVKGSISVVPMFQSDNTLEDQNLLEIAQSNSTDGVIAFQGVKPEIRAELEQRGIPFIIINPGIETTDAVSVILDFEALSFQATTYLTKQGHRSIGMIGMACMPLFFDQTKRGFLRALEQAGISPNADWIRGEADSEAGGGARDGKYAQDICANRGVLLAGQFCHQRDARLRGARPVRSTGRLLYRHRRRAGSAVYESAADHDSGAAGRDRRNCAFAHLPKNEGRQLRIDRAAIP